MDIGADENAAPSSSERVIRHLETRVLDCHLTILSRALLINTLEEANGITVTNLLAQNQWGLADLATQCSTEAESEWERVGTLEVALRRNWLLFESHVAQTYLDLFRKRGPAIYPAVNSMGRVCVPEVEQIMWPSWIGAFRMPVITDEGILETLPGGLSRPCYRCEEPPCRHRFLDVTLRTRVLQLATAVREVMRRICIVIAYAIGFGTLCPALVIIFVSILGLIPSPGFILSLCCLPALFVLATVMRMVDVLLWLVL